MTDKEQIMIDGVDVSGCKCLHNVKVITELAQPEDFEILCGATNGAIKCEKWKDCYFKQLTRKTQECEELKRKVELIMDCPDCKVDEYKKALEEIEGIIASYKEQCNIPNNCIDNRLCSTCFLGGANELGESILDIINKAKDGNDGIQRY